MRLLRLNVLQCSFLLFVTLKVQNKTEEHVPYMLWNGVEAQHGHLVGSSRLGVCLIQAGGAAYHGSGGWWGCGGGGRSRAGHTITAQGGTCAPGRVKNSVLLLWQFVGILCDAEDELKAAEFNVTSMVQESRALPACTAATYEAGTANFTAACRLHTAPRLTAHHSPSWHKTNRLVILSFLAATWKHHRE